jgi:putative membrane protein
MTETFRRPAAFAADDPRIMIAPSAPAADAALALREAEIEGTAVAQRPPVARRRLRWGAMFWSALSGLALLALGVAITNFIEELFARTPWLGAIGLALAAVVGIALIAIVSREVLGLFRLARIEALRERATAAMTTDDRDLGRGLVADLLSLTHRMPQLARARTRLHGHLSEIIDGRDLVRLAERELMTPLDAEARRLVATASKRVSVVTAVSPRAAVDMAFVVVNALGLIRRLAVLYGGRPGTLGLLKLFRQVMTHLAVTGGMAVTDSLLQQVIGHGLAAKLSARLGEGVLNGLLTARLGLLAIDLTRPLPFTELPRPTLNELAGSLIRSTESKPD